MATKHYQVKVPDTNAQFFEELLTALQFVEFNHTRTTGQRSHARETREGAARRYNAEHEQEIIKLRDVMKNIEKIRDSCTR